MTPSIGQNIKLIRESKGISLEEIAKHTRIRLSTLRALEEDDYSKIPSHVQARGFLKLISNYLNTDLKTLQSDPPEKIDQENEKPDQQKDLTNLKELSSETAQISDFKLEKDAAAHTEYEEILPEIIESSKYNESQKFFSEIGQELKYRRNSLGLSLERIADQIHISKEYLVALEAGNIDIFPTSIQAKGYLQNYGKFLDLDMDEVLLKFADGLQTRRAENQNAKDSKNRLITFASPRLVSLKKIFTLDLLFGSVVILGILVFLIWGTSNMINATREPKSAEDIPEIAEVLITPINIQDTPTFTGEISETPSQDTQIDEEPTPIFTPIAQESPIQIVIVAMRDAWVKVTSDGKVAYQGRVLPGNAYTYTGNRQVEILTGDGSAIQVFFNQENIGNLGMLGQVIQATFNENGLVRPTPTPTRTPSPTTQFTPQATQETMPLP